MFRLTSLRSQLCYIYVWDKTSFADMALEILKHINKLTQTQFCISFFIQRTGQIEEGKENVASPT